MVDKNKEIIEQLGRCVKELAKERAMILKLGIMTEEQVTQYINDEGVKYAEKYEEMSEGEILVESFIELLQSVEKSGKENK